MKYFFSGIFLFVFFITSAQVEVCLDHWYNHETNAKTGQAFHYLWTDTLNSGFSCLGEVFVTKGGVLSTLEHAPDAASLVKADIYIIVDPDTTSENPNPNYIREKESQAIRKWVKKGGVLLILANDAPNCEFTHLNRLSGPFGLQFNKVSCNPVTGLNWEMGAETNLPDHALFRGVKKIYMKEVSSIHVNGNARKVLSDGDNTFVAECAFGKGFVLAVGDPWLYNEYIDHKVLPGDFENMKAAGNLVDYLIGKVVCK
jgi:hypothetical protein